MKPLLRMLARRALQAVLVALLVGTLGFFMVHMLPGDMAYRIAAGRYGYDLVSTAAAEAVRAELGLDRPLWMSLLAWWGDIVRLDLGVSLISEVPVIEEIEHQLGHTLMLSFAALGLSLLVGPPLGILAGLWRGGWLDRATLGLAVLLRALPPFMLGLLLMIVLAVHTGMLPVAGHGEDGSLLLPALTLACGLAAMSCRVARDAMVAVTSSPFYGFARTKGLSETLVLLRHGLRNAGVPIVAYVGVQLVFLIEGVVVVESLFAWPGIGHALVHAIFGRDVPMLQGTALTLALMFVLLNTMIDLACMAIDPRRRKT